MTSDLQHKHLEHTEILEEGGEMEDLQEGGVREDHCGDHQENHQVDHQEEITIKTEITFVTNFSSKHVTLGKYYMTWTPTPTNT